MESSSHPWLTLSQDANSYPHAIANPTNLLRQAGIEGPYALAVSPQGYTRIAETAEHGGYPLQEHLTKILSEDVVWGSRPGCALVVSKRGGDFILDVGQDFSIGYARHDAALVTLKKASISASPNTTQR